MFSYFIWFSTTKSRSSQFENRPISGIHAVQQGQVEVPMTYSELFEWFSSAARARWSNRDGGLHPSARVSLEESVDWSGLSFPNEHPQTMNFVGLEVLVSK